MTARAAWLAGWFMLAVAVPAQGQGQGQGQPQAQHNGTAVTAAAEQIVQWLTGTFRSGDGAILRIVRAPISEVDPMMLFVEDRQGRAPPDYYLFGLVANIGRTAAEDNVRFRRHWMNSNAGQQSASGLANPEELRALGPKQLSHQEGCDINLRPRDPATYVGHSDPATCVSDSGGDPAYTEETLELTADSLRLIDRVWHDKMRSDTPSESSMVYQRATN